LPYILLIAQRLHVITPTMPRGMRGRRSAIGHEHFDLLIFFGHGLVDLFDCLKQWNTNFLVLGERDECIQIFGEAHAYESSATVYSPFLKVVSEPEGE